MEILIDVYNAIGFWLAFSILNLGWMVIFHRNVVKEYKVWAYVSWLVLSILLAVVFGPILTALIAVFECVGIFAHKEILYNNRTETLPRD